MKASCSVGLLFLVFVIYPLVLVCLVCVTGSLGAPYTPGSFGNVLRKTICSSQVECAPSDILGHLKK